MAEQIPALTEEQQTAHDTLADYITGKSNDFRMYDLLGYAGTGKTFTLTRIVSTLRRLNNQAGFGEVYRVAMSAPTHKAVRVMRKFSRNLTGVTYATIHSLLGLKAEIDNRTGKQRFVQSKDPDQVRISSFNVLILDEVSMLADELFALLLDCVKESGLKLVFVGDPKQIPPVNHLDAKPLLPGQQQLHKIGVVTLETIMRQALDNPILAYATRIRKAVPTTESFRVDTHLWEPQEASDDIKRGIITVKADDEFTISNIIAEHFCCEDFKQDADHMKIICWRNATVDNFNREVRKLIYAGTTLPEGYTKLPFIMPGEKLIMDEPVVLASNRILLSTNEEVEVDRYILATTTIQYLSAYKVDHDWSGRMEEMEVKYYNTWVNYFDEEGIEQQCNIRILHEDDQPKFTAVRKATADMALAVPFASPYRSKLWQSYYALQKLFAVVKYNYAITAHKSQGSTYENCMVVDWDLAANRNVPERNRIRYVAVTRARSLLYVVQ